MVKLKNNATLLDVVMLGAGAAIGSSIFAVLAPAARTAGSSLLWAIAAAVVPMAILAVVYAYVASAVPRSGASYEWPREFIGPRFAFLVAWLRILSSTGMQVTGTLVMARYLEVFTPLPPTPTMLALTLSVYLLNLVGVSFAAKAQTILMSILLLSFAVFVVTAAGHGQASNITPLASNIDGWALLATLPLLINLFMGIETATEIGEEVHDAKRNIPLGIGIAVGLTLLVYLTVTVTAIGVIGIEGIAANDTPLATAAQRTGSTLSLTLITGAALLCLAKSINVNFMIFSRNLFVMGRSGILPEGLSRVHPRYGTPHVASTVVLMLTLLGMLLPRDLVYLFIATSVPTLLKYLSTCLCAIRIALHRQDLTAQARFVLPKRIACLFAGVGAICAAGIALMGIQTDWRPYLLIGAWATLGVVYWLWRKPANATVDALS